MHEMRREDRAGIAETVVDFRISRTIAWSILRNAHNPNQEHCSRVSRCRSSA